MQIFKKNFILYSLFILNSAMANDLACSTSINTNSISRVSLNVEVGIKAVYEEIEGYKLMIKNLGKHKYELEVLEEDTPSRGYATGLLRTGADELSWAKWSREILIETSCKLDPASLR